MLRDLSSFINLQEPVRFTLSKEILNYFSTHKTSETDRYDIPHFIGEFFNNIHTKNIHFIKYPLSSQPRIASFFIRLLSDPNDFIYDPFVGRGTTMLEALLLKRYAMGSDSNTLIKDLILPRFHIHETI